MYCHERERPFYWFLLRQSALISTNQKRESKANEAFNKHISFFEASTESINQFNLSTVLLRMYGLSEAKITKSFQIISISTSLLSLSWAFLTVSHFMLDHGANYSSPCTNFIPYESSLETIILETTEGKWMLWQGFLNHNGHCLQACIWNASPSICHLYDNCCPQKGFSFPFVHFQN